MIRMCFKEREDPTQTTTRQGPRKSCFRHLLPFNCNCFPCIRWAIVVLISMRSCLICDKYVPIWKTAYRNVYKNIPIQNTMFVVVGHIRMNVMVKTRRNKTQQHHDEEVSVFLLVKMMWGFCVFENVRVQVLLFVIDGVSASRLTCYHFPSFRNVNCSEIRRTLSGVWH
mmetsp:Transcript_12250/g.28384  ORF Transcript_12250/g.28384 Transcript_12250/m.28384 type:complete len:169 (+) Transcript_12250:235-741(+)